MKSLVLTCAGCIYTIIHVSRTVDIYIYIYIYIIYGIIYLCLYMDLSVNLCIDARMHYAYS